MPMMVRAACLTGYAEFARSIGLDTGKMLRKAGLDVSCLTNPDQKISCDAFDALLENSADAAQTHDLGLRLARGRHLSNFGPVALAIRDAPTAREAMITAIRYMPLQSEAVMLRAEPVGDVTILKIDLMTDARLPGRQRTDLTVATLHNLMRQISGARWRAPQVWLSGSRPNNIANYLRHFGPWIEFGRDFNALVFDSADLDAPLDSADPRMTAHVKQYLEPLLAAVNLSLAEKTKRLVSDLLITRRASADLVATGLGLNRRTLHRRLAQDGTTFSSIVDDVRSALAQQYLGDDGLPLTEVAQRLGFSVPSSFSRWFRAEFDCSPLAWRSAERNVPEATSR